MAAELQELYGDIEAMDFYIGFLLEERQNNSPFGQTLIEIGAPYSLKGLLANPISSPQYWKPSTFGGEVHTSCVVYFVQCVYTHTHTHTQTGWIQHCKDNDS